jgi:hypothetical protein
MDQKQRHKRLRLLIGKLNKERKTQVKKIDMLCNDLIAAQRDFIKKLNTVSFAADFYKSILGITDLDRLLSTAGKLIKDELDGASVTVFLRNGFSQSGAGSREDELRVLENCYTAELVDNICKSNNVCSLDDMFAMGLQGNLVELNKISAYAISLSQLGPAVGFILIYRSSENKITADELNKVSAIISGLSRAIKSCATLRSSSAT